MSNQVIDVEATSTQAEPDTKQQPTMAVATRPGMAVGQAMTVEQLHERLEFIRNVMKREMREGQDYGKIPGTGDKPSLLQPGAQKLLMTFNLREQIRKETLREIPHQIYGHREYEFTVVVFPAGLKPEDGWDGVGTCSTMESKYRYRKATRKCPECGKEAIIAGKEEFGGGFICWKKKDGCGAKFHAEHPAIISQSVEDVENEDPADCWNTVRKMAFKRALVAAAINATNTSELWTQDVEDMVENKGRQKGQAGPQSAQNAPGRKTPPQDTTPPPQNSRTAAKRDEPIGKTAPAGSPKTITPQQAIFADSDTRARMIVQLKDSLSLAHEFFVKAGCILETEKLEDLPLRFVPVTRRQFQALQNALAGFGNGEEALLPYAPNPEAESSQKSGGTLAATTSQGRKSAATNPPPQKPADRVDKSPSVESAKAKDPEWFFKVICPIPNKGQKRDDYLKKPDTILSLYRRMKEGDEGAQKRLWGFAKHWAPTERQVGNKIYQPSAEDLAFREALDAFCDWEEKHGKDTHQAEPELLPRPAGVTRHQNPQVPAELPDHPEEDDVPW